MDAPRRKPLRNILRALAVIAVLAPAAAADKNVRPAAFAGQFYTADPARLGAEVDGHPAPPAPAPRPRAAPRVDAALAREIARASGSRFRPEAFAEEHSVEVQVPFVQRVLPGAAIVPLVMGTPPRPTIPPRRPPPGRKGRPAQGRDPRPDRFVRIRRPRRRLSRRRGLVGGGAGGRGVHADAGRESRSTPHGPESRD